MSKEILNKIEELKNTIIPTVKTSRIIQKIKQLLQAEEKIETAWDMFRRLSRDETCYKFHKLLYKKLFPNQIFGNMDQWDIHCQLSGKIFLYEGQEAIKIMKGIEISI